MSLNRYGFAVNNKIIITRRAASPGLYCHRLLGSEPPKMGWMRAEAAGDLIVNRV